MPTQIPWMTALEETIFRTIAEGSWDQDSESTYTFDLAGRATAHPIATAGCRKITVELDVGAEFLHSVPRDLLGNTNDREFCGAPTDTLLLIDASTYEVTFMLRERAWGEVWTAFGWITFVDDRGCPLYERADFGRLRETTDLLS